MADVNRAGTFSKGRQVSSLKEACQRREKNQLKRVQVNKLEYMDSMQESLNKQIQDSVNPYWRNHASLKGKQTVSLEQPILTVTFAVCPTKAGPR